MDQFVERAEEWGEIPANWSINSRECTAWSQNAQRSKQSGDCQAEPAGGWGGRAPPARIWDPSGEASANPKDLVERSDRKRGAEGAGVFEEKPHNETEEWGIITGKTRSFWPFCPIFNLAAETRVLGTF